MREALDNMERLDFTLPDFTRVSWVNDELRAVWEPRIQRISSAFSEIEWRSVKDGIRSCALTVLTPEAMIKRAAEWAEEGLAALPLEVQGLANYYASTTVSISYGQPVGLRVVIGKPQDVAEFKKAYDAADDIRIGQLLGFPECCQKFFDEVWVNRQMVDTTWPMGVQTAKLKNGETTVEVSGPVEANILWRWMGVRSVPHLPCGFDCENTVAFGKALIGVGRDAGYDEEMNWLEEILSWPAEWSALHGIAEIKTPLLRVSTRTDATACKYSVRRTSDTYPVGGVSALKFPFKTPKKPILTSATHFKRGLENVINVAVPKPSWYAKDNGFNSAITMDNAHRPIVDLASVVLGQNGGGVLDLGCGNGALLKKIMETSPKVVPYGIESDAKRLANSSELLPDHADNLVVGDMFSDERIWADDRHYALVLMMPGRLLETDKKNAKALRERLKSQCDNILVYAYGDWLARFGDLNGLIGEAKMEMLGITAGRGVGLARVI